MKICIIDDCQNLCEGTTDRCAHHNRIARKKANDRKKSAENEVRKFDSYRAWHSRKRKKPNKISKKRAELNEEYFKLVEQFKKDNPECKAKCNEYCTKTTEDPHHSRGRGVFLLDTSTWIPVCRSCHSYIESHPQEAKERGWSESRLAKEKPII